jgi:hypothetical protein
MNGSKHSSNLRSIIKLEKSSRKRWAGHVARIGTKISTHNILVGKPEGNRQFGRSSIKGRSEDIGRELWTDSNWQRVQTNDDLL